MTFLDDLYYGNIKPVDNGFVKNSEFDKALKVFCDCETELCKAIDKDADEALTRLINSHNELLATTGLENFKIGFRLGVKMMCDAFIDKSDKFKDVTD
ncbi:MAG: hypothetical protein J1F64_06185 [Oscillospiraceae bacterium]|nr:hypothetical protein [Oscillospiraceae bacterium]